MYLAAVSTQMIAIVSVSVLVWLGCAFYAGGLARNNGRSYNMWFLVGFLLGPVGLLITWLYFQLSGERHQRHRHSVGRRSDIPEMVKCPRCGQSVPTSFDCCQFCGAPVRGGKRSR